MLVLALTAAALGSAAAAWMLDRRRCRRRNVRGECGACGVSWAETPSGDPYLIHGRLVCEGCARKAKRRLPWELGALAVFVALSTGSALTGRAIEVIAISVVVSTIAMTLGAVHLMKVANRIAQRRIAAGEFPDFDALGAGSKTDAKAAVTGETAV